MTTLEERLRAGGAILVFDAANVSTKTLFALANAARERGTKLHLIVPITSYVEKVFDIRQARAPERPPYDPGVVLKALGDKQVDIVSLDVDAAEAAATTGRAGRRTTSRTSSSARSSARSSTTSSSRSKAGSTIATR